MWSAIRSMAASIRLHILVGYDRVGTKSLVDETLLLQPADLVCHVPHVELAVRIDIGAVADYLLEGKVGVFRDDLQQWFCLVVDRRLATGDGRQDHIMVFAIRARQHGETFRHPRL